MTAYTAEMYPTRIRGVGNGFSWAVAFVIGAVLWPFVSVYLSTIFTRLSRCAIRQDRPECVSSLLIPQ